MQVASVPVEDGAIAKRLRAKRVIADRPQDAAERRVPHPKQHQEGDRGDGEYEIIRQNLACDRDAENLALDQLEARLQLVGNLERAPVLAPGQP
jgi:hypothetical protein